MKTQEIMSYTESRLKRLWALPENRRRAELAQLRRGVGYAPGELPELWGTFLQEMPEDFYGKKAPSRAEWAVYLALTLYAVHQQGSEVPMHRKGNTVGRAVRLLVPAEQELAESSVLRRFNALATADSMPELSHHLRGMVQLLRAAKPAAIPLDYAQLAADLYELQFEERAANVRLRWGQDLYRTPVHENAETKEKEN